VTARVARYPPTASVSSAPPLICSSAGGRSSHRFTQASMRAPRLTSRAARSYRRPRPFRAPQVATSRYPDRRGGEIYPRSGPRPTGSKAEKRVYRALAAALPDGWVAWHSLKLRVGAHYEGEGDFVIAAPDRGLLVLEV